MAGSNERKEGQDGEESLQDSFLSSFAIGLMILAIWVWILFVYLDRL